MAPKDTTATLSVPSSASAIAGELRERIRSDYYKEGQWLPSERVLAADLKAHRRSVRGAIAQLAEEGLISIRPHCRPLILPRATETAAPPKVASVSKFRTSRLIALVMWHGGGDQAASPQQRIFWGMNQALAKEGYHGVFLDLGEEIGSEQQNADREAARLTYALDHEFGGIIFYAYAYHRNRELVQRISRQLPLVLIDRMLSGVETDYVGIDNHKAMYDATWHLIRQGHRRIAYATRSEVINPVQDRLEGYRHALREAFGEDRREIVLTANSWSGNDWLIFDTLFRLPDGERPSAIICVNDTEAVHIAHRLTGHGLRVPQDVALVGFDDIVHTLPGGVSLTTVAQPFETIGRSAAQTLLQRIESPFAPPIHLELPAQLIIRDSSTVEPAMV